MRHALDVDCVVAGAFAMDLVRAISVVPVEPVLTWVAATITPARTKAPIISGAATRVYLRGSCWPPILARSLDLGWVSFEFISE